MGHSVAPFGENDSAETTLDEALILSTCNRVEILAVGQGDVPGLILEAWASAKNRKAVELAPYVYIHKGREAIAHLFTVASSLDSMVLGEPQILGSSKEPIARQPWPGRRRPSSIASCTNRSV